MRSDTARPVSVGEVVGFGRVWNPFVKKAKVRVKANGRVVAVLVDHRQLQYIRDRHSAGRGIAIGFYGGEWHIGSPPSMIGADRRNGAGDISLLQREMENLDLASLVGRPVFDRNTRPNDIARALKMGATASAEDAMLEDLEKYRDYLKLVERDTLDNGRELLDRLGLAHLKEANDNKKHASNDGAMGPWKSDGKALLELILAQNERIIANQNELIRILAEHSGLNRNDRVSSDRLN